MAGGSKSESKPKDMTPQVFKDLQEPFGSVIAQLIGFQRDPYSFKPISQGGQPSGGIQANMGPGSGGAPSQFVNSGGRQHGENGPVSRPSAVQAARQRRDGGTPMASAARSAGGSAQGSAFNPGARGTYQPLGDPSDLLRGIPGYEGPTTAGLGANEQTLLDRLMGIQGGGTGTPGQGSQAQDLLSRTMRGDFLQGPTNTGNLSQFTQMLQDSSAAPERSNQSLAQFVQEIQQASAQPNANPSLAQFAQELAGAAQAPGMDQMSLQDFAAQFRGAQGTPQAGSTSLTDFMQQRQGALQLPGAGSQSLASLAAERAGARQSQGYQANDNNPFMQAAIEAAQRPTMQALEETLGRTLPGRFTQAGHFTQPSGSSAFDRAAAIATRGAGQTMGDIAANISFASTDAERNRQFTAQEGERSREDAFLGEELNRRGMFDEAARESERAAISEELNRRGIFEEAARAREAQAIMAEQERRGAYGEAARARESQALQAEAGRRSDQAEAARARESQMLAQELERRGQFDEAARVREAAMVDSELGRRATSTEAERNRQQQAASQLPGVTQQEIQTTIQNLQAQALPRMIEELGIERGLEQFQNRMNTLLATLGMGAGVTAPVIGQQSSSKTKPNVLGPALGAL